MIIFFIRRFNDIDHLVPIIYKMALKKSDNLLVLCLNPGLQIQDDYRLLFLKEKYNVTLDYLYGFHTPGIKTKFLSYLVINKNTISGSSFMIFASWIFWLLSKLLKGMVGENKYQQLIENTFNIEWFSDLLKIYSPRLLVFDWIKDYQHNAGILFDAAKKSRIPIIALPHGLNLMTSKFHTNKEEDQSRVSDQSSMFRDFNYFVVSSQTEKEQRIARDLDKNKIVVLGSSRFSKEWIKINNSIVPNYLNEKYSDGGKIKVVFMEHSNHYRANEELIIKSINKIAELDFVRLIIKAHTRSNRFFNEYSNVEFADRKVTSTELCKWADIVIVTMSSIAIEPLLRGKVLLYPEYFHRNHTLWGDLGACWKINDQDELIEAMHMLKENPDFRPYTQNDVQSFLNTAIYNGNGETDVLTGYTEFILGICIPSEHMGQKELI